MTGSVISQRDTIGRQAEINHASPIDEFHIMVKRGSNLCLFSILAAIRDPKHEQHDEMVEWLGEDFNPEAFDLVKINNAFARKKVQGENNGRI